MAFVVALQPCAGLFPVDELARSVPLPLSLVEDECTVEPGEVYVVPPGVVARLGGGTLASLTRAPAPDGGSPIDALFASLAADQGAKAAAVLLPGTLPDGAAGLKAIRVHGGLTLASGDDAPWADRRLPPEAIAAQLDKLARWQRPTEMSLRKIFVLIRKTVGVDFSGYRRDFLARRVLHRMALHDLPCPDDYVRLLKKQPCELEGLVDDFLVPVSGFSKDFFEAPPTPLLRKVVLNRADQGSIRAWVPGCATGEEAYALAMNLAESLEETETRSRVQVFGTDLSAKAIAAARSGVYTEANAAEAGQDRLRHFFRQTDAGHQVRWSVREQCVFTRHNVAKDPPFPKLDLISCRNVLLHMHPGLQRKALSMLHRALKPNGILVLGGAEDTSAAPELFAPLEGRVYEKVAARGARTERAVEACDPWSGPRLRREAGRILLDEYTPPAVIVDGDLELVESHGNTALYLPPDRTAVTPNLGHAGSPEFKQALRAAIDEVKASRQAVRKPGLQCEGHAAFDLRVIPLLSLGPPDHFLLLFETSGSGTGSPAPGHHPVQPETARLRAGEAELLGLKQELATLSKRLEAFVRQRPAFSHHTADVEARILDRLFDILDPALLIGPDLSVRGLSRGAAAVLPAAPGEALLQVEARAGVRGLADLVSWAVAGERALWGSFKGGHGRFYTAAARPLRRPDGTLEGAFLMLACGPAGPG